MTLGRTIPALPVRDLGSALTCYRERFGYTVLHSDDHGFAVLQRDDSRLHLWVADDEEWQTRSRSGSPVRSGAESFLAGTASARIEVDDGAAVDALYAELSAAGVLHPAAGGGPHGTDFGSYEFPTVDADGNLLEFFTWTAG